MTDFAGLLGFDPLNNQVINYKYFVTDASSTIRLRIDDPDGLGGIDITFSSIAVVGPTKSFIFDNDHLSKTTITTGISSCTFICQLNIPLEKDGSDDGEYTISITPQDNAGNIGSVYTRKFIYDTTKPTITQDGANPTSGTTEEKLTFKVTATDTNGLSNSAAVQLVVSSGPTSTPFPFYNMTSQGNDIYSLDFTAPSKNPGTYKYYFTCTDKAGNVSVYPENADSDLNLCLSLDITDATAPSVEISKIETLVNFNYTGIDPVYDTSQELNSVPTVYSYDNNVLEATVESGTTEVIFQFKLSTASSSDFQDLPTMQTETLTVWRSTWNTTGLTLNTNYDIRAKAKDSAGNWNIPQDSVSDGWVEINLKPTLSPVVKIDTTTNTGRLDINKVVYGKELVVNALRCGIDDSSSGNIDFAEVKFKYKEISGSNWYEISTDTDASSSELKNIVFHLDEADIPNIQRINNGVNIGEITQIKIDFTGGTTYDRVLTKTGDLWQTTVPLPPGTHDYLFEITHQISSGTVNTDSVRDPHEYGTSAGNSRIVVNPFSCVFDISTRLTDGKTYQIRAAAKDSKGNEDSEPEYLTFTYDSSKPSAPSLIEPSENVRIQANNGAGANETYHLIAEISDSDTEVVIFEMSDKEKLYWENLSNDTVGSDGWSQTSNAESVSNDTVKYIRAFAVDKAGNISSASSETKVIFDATAPQIIEFSIEGATSTVTLDNDKQYVVKVKTTDSDVKRIIFSNTGVSGTWSPSATITEFTGSGTEEDPYVYFATFSPSDTDLTSGQITATIEDTSIDATDDTGNQSSKSIDVTVRDVTPSEAEITSIAGQTVSGQLIYVSASAASISASVAPVDGGVVKFQYAHKESSSTWVQFAEVTSANLVNANWDTVALGLSEGDYYLRAVCIDDDGLTDPEPETVLVRVNNIKPEILEFTVDDSTGDIVLDSGKQYLFKMITKSTDVENVVFAAPSGSWYPSATVTAYTIGGGSRVYQAYYTSDLTDTAEDKILQVTLTDIAGNQDTEQITGVKIKDVTPSEAEISAIK